MIALAYLLCLVVSLVTLAVTLLRHHPAPTPTPTPAAPTMAAPDANRLDATARLLRATADQLDTYRPAA